LRVESVAWVSERKDVLSGLFLMLTLAMYERHFTRPQTRYLVAAVLLYACGLMSKPTLVSVPFLLLLLDYWPLGRIGPRSRGSGAVSDALPAGKHSVPSGSNVKSQMTSHPLESKTTFPSPPLGGREQGEGGPAQRQRLHLFLEKLPFFAVAVVSAAIT